MVKEALALVNVLSAGEHLISNARVNAYTDNTAFIHSWGKQGSLLYLPTQIRFLIGGERVTCHWSKLNDALGRTKLNDALGKQQLELWNRT